MNVTDFLADHGYWVVLLAVLADQSGLPLPAAPVLIAAGALIRDGSLRPLPVMLLAVSASMVGHTAWFVAGKQRGIRMLQRVCKLALEPDACVRRTQDLFTKMGPLSLLAARFIPGLDTMAQPLAGMSGMSLGRYLILSVIGAVVWAGGLLGAGALFGPQLKEIFQPLRNVIGQGLEMLLVAAFVLYLGNKIWQRYRTLKKVRMSRITVEELKQRMDAGEPFVVYDLRHRLEAQLHPHTIPGAIHLERSELDAQLRALRPEQEVVLFCNCPYEIASARMALTIVKRGHAKVRPLEGGLDAWESRKYPLVPYRIARRQSSEPSVR